MKLFESIRLTILSALMCCPGLLMAQGAHPLTRQEIDSLLNPSLLKGADKLLEFERTVINLGEMTEDDAPVTVKFAFRNTGTQPVVITKIHTDCGCTAAQTDKLQIQPGEKGSISVTYTPKNHPGTIDANTFVYSSLSDKQPLAKLVLLGNVQPGGDEWSRYPYAMGKLRLKQNKVTFRIAAGGNGRQTERILCGNSGTTDLKLSVMNLPRYATFKTEPEVIKPGQEADIVISIDASKMTGKTKSFKAPLILDGVTGRPSDRTLTLEVNLTDK